MTKNTQRESYESREGTSDFRLQTFDFRLPEIFLNKFFINFFKNFLNKKLVGSTQQQILSTLFIIRLVSSDHTDFIKDLTRLRNKLLMY